MANKVEMQYLTISISAGYQEVVKQKDGESETASSESYPFSDTITLDFTNESNLNRALLDKPYMEAIASVIVKRIQETHDGGNKAAKAFLEKLK